LRKGGAFPLGLRRFRAQPQYVENLVTRVQQELIAGILDQVQQELGAASFNVWFKDSTHLSLDRNTLNVGVPNLFVCDYVESRYATTIARVAARQLGAEVAVQFQIDPQLFRERRRSQLNAGKEFLAAQDIKDTPKPRPKPARTSHDDSRQEPPLTLERFVVGDCNRIAYAAALEVARNPGKAFNPLFIHSSCGLGKTHLLQGIVHAVRQRFQTPRVLYITAEQFTNRYIMAIKTRSLDAFRHRFRSLDLLAIDDIHFLAGKDATQGEFLHTFNAFDLANRQVVMASDCHPKMLNEIQDPLVNRFVAGMIARMSSPDRNTRVEILRHKAAQMGTRIADDVLTLLAQHVAGSVRELEGALIRVVAYASLDKRPITLSLAQEAMAEHISAGESRIHLDTIIDTACRFFGVPKSEIIGRRRTRSFTLPRQFAMYLMRQLTPLSFPEIGRHMGGKNHTTVIAACRRVEKMLQDNQQVTWHDGAIKQQMTATDLVHALEDRLRS